MGRPSIYSIELAAAICARLASGEPLVRICRDDGMPNVTTVYQWLATKPDFANLYARAREDQADTLADEIVAIADEVQVGEKRVTKADGGIETTTGDMVDRSRLRIDARKWVAAKLKPKKYGERIQQEITGKVTLEDLLTGKRESEA